MNDAPSVRAAHARLAAHQRHHGPDDPATAAAQAELRTAVATAYLERLVSEAPPIDDATRLRLAAIICSPPAQDGAA